MYVPGLLIAAPSSGSGKTSAACALMAAFTERGLTVRACKCGPDYIDPMFHREVLGVDSRNLDLFFSSADALKEEYKRHVSGADLVLTEGVMGYYDGMNTDTDAASSYDVSRTLELPVILVLSGRGASLSLAAVAKGMAQYRPDSRIRGILLNRVSGMLYPRLKSMLERELKKTGCEIPVVGYMPEDEAFSFKSRHLGLVTPRETEGLKRKTRRAGEILSRTADLDLIYKIAEEGAVQCAEARKDAEEKETALLKRNLRIGIARDRAFCFYYTGNIELLEKQGCRLIPFSPLSDRELPGDLDGLILGGGYPELYARELSENLSMLKSVRKALRRGMPCIAECGGFMYLHEKMEDENGREYPMTAVLPGKTFPAGKLVRFGYICISSADSGKTGAAGYIKPGEMIRGHEFHYWDSTDNGRTCRAVKPDGRRSWDCICAQGNLFAGYPHLYMPSLPEFAKRFAERCEEWKKRRKKDGRDESER